MASQVPTQANIQSTHPFTCNTCQVAFRSSDLQRAHMQTDWHRYNLKRRVASLPPLSSEIFTEKVLANKATAAATAAKASFEKVCTPCQKTYFSENAYNNHLNSSKHRINMAKSGRGAQLDDAASVTGSMVSSAFSLGESMADSEVTTVNGDADKDVADVADGLKNASIEEQNAEEAATADGDKTSVAASNKPASDPLLDCLFCNYKSPNFQLNITHMGRFHGMFIPEKEFLAQPEGLIKHLHEKIHAYHECLKCHKVLHTASGIQTHMRDRGHCMIAFDTDIELVEIGEFYDSLWIKIEHNGKCLSPNEQLDIFQPFYAITNHESTCPVEQRLSYSYFIITDHHRGQMAVTSDEQNGTCFNIQLALS